MRSNSQQAQYQCAKAMLVLYLPQQLLLLCLRHNGLEPGKHHLNRGQGNAAEKLRNQVSLHHGRTAKVKPQANGLITSLR